ncbi:MAG: IS110 family transposase [Methanobacteriota archaeon]|nr:MAG: IS110 family transposase [Euryarchaeota archaeon]
MDVHKGFSHAIVMTETGEVLKEGRIETSSEGMKGFFQGLPPSRIAMESTRAWEPVYEALTELGHDVRLSHPMKTKAIAYAKVKTDKVDARTLADLLRANLLPQSYVPPKEIRNLRNICRERSHIVGDRTRWKNRLRAELGRRGIKPPFKNLYNRDAKSWLKSLKIRKLDRILSFIEFLDFKVQEIDQHLHEYIKSIPEIKILTTIPGVGAYSAAVIYSEIGEIERFPTSEKLCAYAGLVPSTHQSGSHAYHGRITKEGSRYLRWILVECAQIHVAKFDTRVTRFHNRLKYRVGKQKAVVASARKLCKIIFWMLTCKEGFKG